jgi:outer membrane lipoprotein-sorting protein
MKRIVKIICVAIVLASPAARGQTNAPSLERITATMSQAHTIFTRFVQERHLALFNEPLRSEGFLCFQEPGHIRWETLTPYQSILISDGSGVAQFEWAGEHWKKLDLGLGDALQHIMSQIAGVMDGRFARDPRGYAATVTNGVDELVVTLIPQNETIRKVMAAIELHLAADLKATRRIVLRETDGDYTEIIFSEQSVNFILPARTFDRVAPAALAELQAAARAKP